MYTYNKRQFFFFREGKGWHLSSKPAILRNTSVTFTGQAKAAGVNPNFFSFTGFVAKKAIDLGDAVEPPRKKPKLVPETETER